MRLLMALISMILVVRRVLKLRFARHLKVGSISASRPTAVCSPEDPVVISSAVLVSLLTGWRG